MDLANKKIVVTGSSRGLGAGMARWFVERGAAVGLCARHKPEIQGGKVVSAAVDMVDLASVEEFAALVNSQLGPIDLWINNAGTNDAITPQRSLTYEALEAQMRINVGGVLNGTQTFLSHLESVEHRGVLVNITSGAAQSGMAGTSAYCASKAAVDRLTEVVALEEKDLLIRALAVGPGVVETDMQALLRRQDEAVLHDVAFFRKLHADNAMNTPSWVASHIADLAFSERDPESVVVRVPPEVTS